MKVKVLLIILIIAVLGIGAYVFLSNNQVVITPKNNKETMVTPAPETVLVTPVITDQPQVTVAPTTTEDLKTIIRDLLVAKHGANAAKLIITVSKIQGNYASGGASVPSEGGGMWFAAKVNDVWQLVWDGNGIISCTDLAPYPDLPSSMIPECFNETTDQLQTR